MSSSSFPPAMPQTTKHLLQGLPDWLTSDRAKHPMADLLGARAQAWQPRRPTAMKRKAERVLHLWRILLAAAATTSTCASAKTSSPAQGIFRVGNRQSTTKKQMLVNPRPGESFLRTWQLKFTSGVKGHRNSLPGTREGMYAHG